MKALIHICSSVGTIGVELSDQVSLSLSKIEDLHTHAHRNEKKNKNKKNGTRVYMHL